jgi:gamma-glutamyl hydrolase
MRYLIVTLLFSIFYPFKKCENYSPVIAIYGNTDYDNSESYLYDKVKEYYVRWLEQSGAQTMVIHTWYSNSQIDKILQMVNGVFFQGGDRDLNLENRWERVGRYIFQKIIDLNHNGTYIPLWGTCQGMQLFLSYVANTTRVLEKFNVWEIRTPIIIEKEYIKDFKKDFRMYEYFSKKQIHIALSENITAHFHNLGISPMSFFKTYPELNNFFKISSFGKSKDGNIFVNSIESRNYPIYGIQFHPEKISYDRFNSKALTKELNAIIFSQNLSNFFISECLKNSNNFPLKLRAEYDFIDTYNEVEGTVKYNKWYLFQRKCKIKFLNDVCKISY